MKKILKFILFFLILLGPLNVWCFNVSEIRTEARKLMRDTDTSNPRHTNAHILFLINEAQSEIVRIANPIQKTSSYILTQGTTYYNLPQGFVSLSQAIFKDRSNNYYNLTERKIRELYQSNPNWEQSRGQPTEYLITPATSSNVSSTVTVRISYIPIPSNNTSTGTITLRYNSEAAELTADSDIPFEARRELYQYHYAIVHYVVFRLKILDGIMDEASTYSNLYNVELSIMKDRYDISPNYNPGIKAGSGANR